jgi:hypothetical protein
MQNIVLILLEKLQEKYLVNLDAMELKKDMGQNVLKTEI